MEAQNSSFVGVEQSKTMGGDRLSVENKSIQREYLNEKSRYYVNRYIVFKFITLEIFTFSKAQLL